MTSFKIVKAGRTLIVHEGDQPGSHATMFAPSGERLAFSPGDSSFDDGQRKYAWAFVLPPSGSLRVGQSFVFATIDREVVGVVDRDGLHAQACARGRYVERDADGKPLAIKKGR